MFDWIKKFVLCYLILAIRLSLEMYKWIYLFLDKFIPDGKFKSDNTDEESVFGRDDIFDGEEFFEDLFGDDEFFNKEVDDFKEMLTMCIMLVIYIAMLVLLIRADIWLARMTQHRTYASGDIFGDGLLTCVI